MDNAFSFKPLRGIRSLPSSYVEFLLSHCAIPPSLPCEVLQSLSHTDTYKDRCEEVITEKTTTAHNPVDPHAPGAKLDVGKPRVAMWLRCIPRALLEMSRLATIGAIKYSDYGCLNVPNGENRYEDAMLRHFLSECITPDVSDQETKVRELVAVAWNACIRLELQLRRLECQSSNTGASNVEK